MLTARLKLLKNSIVPLMLGQIGLAITQGLQFLIIARALGPTEFGLVAACLAATAVLLPFSGVGLANVMLLRVARGETRQHLMLGNAFFAVALSASVLVGILSLSVFFISGRNDYTLLIFTFALSEVFLTKYVDVCQHYFLGKEQHRISSKLLLAQSILRLLGAAGLVLIVEDITAQDWAYTHLALGALAAAIVVVYTIKKLGMRPEFDVAQVVADIKTGFFFSLGLSARSVYTDIDKVLLARLADLSTNGAYTAAYRLVFMATTPLSSALLAVQARMYRAGGKEGLAGSLSIAKKSLFIGVPYGVVVGLLIYFLAPYVVLVLGDAYLSAVPILQSLAFLPLPIFIQSILSESLAAADHQRLRSYMQVATAGLSVGLGFLLISMYSWVGAVFTAYASQVALAIFVASTLIFKVRKESVK